MGDHPAVPARSGRAASHARGCPRFIRPQPRTAEATSGRGKVAGAGAAGEVLTFASSRLGLVMVLAWVGVGLQLFRIQVVEAEEYRGRALDQRQREVLLAADRGAIFDRNGRQLAVTIKSWSVIANPRQIEDPNDHRPLGLGCARPRSRRDSPRSSAATPGYVFLARQLEEPEIESLKEDGAAGIFFEEEPKRAYPAGSLAAQVLGFVNIDGEGIEGLEAFYDDELAGEPGYLLNEQDPLGRPIPQGEYQIQPAEPGSNLVLTLDLSIQFMAEQACINAIEITDAKACTIVVLDPHTGEVLAMAVVPTFDPSDRSGVDPEVFQNRAVRYIYEPGSTQKLVTVAAAIEEGVVTWESKFNVPYSIDVADQTFEEYGSAATRGHPIGEGHRDPLVERRHDPRTAAVG